MQKTTTTQDGFVSPKASESMLHKLYIFLTPEKARNKQKMTWPELIHLLMGYRFALLPLQSIMILFMWQSISELATSVYGLHVVKSSSVKQENGYELRYHHSILFIILPSFSPLILIFATKAIDMVASSRLWLGNFLWSYMVLRDNTFANYVFTSIIGFIAIFNRLAAAAIAKENPYHRAIFASCSYACFLLYFPCVLYTGGLYPKRLDEDLQSLKIGLRRKPQHESLTMGVSISIAMLMYSCIRTFGKTLDISLMGWTQIFSYGLALIAIASLVLLLIAHYWEYNYKHHSRVERQSKKVAISLHEIEDENAEWWRLITLSFGVLAIFTLCLFSFATPSIIVRWAEAEYLIVLVIQTTTLAIYNGFTATRPKLFSYLRPWVVCFINLVFFCVMLVVLATQTQQKNIPQMIMLYIISGSAPLMCLNLQLLWNELSRADLQKKIWIVCLGCMIGAFFMTIIILLSSFATFYWPLFGNWLHVKLWILIMIMVAATFVPTIMIRKLSFLYFNDGEHHTFGDSHKNMKMKTFVLATSIFLSILIVMSIIYTIVLNIPKQPTTVPKNVKVMSFDIRQGFDSNGYTNFAHLLAVIDEQDPDIVVLFSTGANQIFGGNRDFVRYLTNSKQMFSYYGPKQNLKLNGIAILAKYRLTNTQTIFMDKDEAVLIKTKVSFSSNISLPVTVARVEPHHYELIHALNDEKENDAMFVLQTDLIELLPVNSVKNNGFIIGRKQYSLQILVGQTSFYPLPLVVNMTIN